MLDEFAEMLRCIYLVEAWNDAKMMTASIEALALVRTDVYLFHQCNTSAGQLPEQAHCSQDSPKPYKEAKALQLASHLQELSCWPPAQCCEGALAKLLSQQEIVK